MISLLIAFAVLIAGYAVYGRVAEKIFAPDDRPTPAIAVNDGVDCVPMKTWKAFLVQLLNIAGTGPIFGALMGAVFGPVVFLWIVFGSIWSCSPAKYESCKRKNNLQSHSFSLFRKTLICAFVRQLCEKIQEHSCTFRSAGIK